MNSLSFIPSLIPSILDGSKTSTYRRGLKKDIIQIGDTIAIKNDDTDEIVTYAIVTNKSQLLFKNLPLSNDGHEEYISREKLREDFNRLYNYIGRPIADDDVFLVIEFQIIK